MKEVETKFDEIKSNEEKKIKALEKINDKNQKRIEVLLEKNDKIEKSLSVKFVTKRKCSKCDFESASERGLKVHIRRKHTEIRLEKDPHSCDLCNYKAVYKKDLRTHKITHS